MADTRTLWGIHMEWDTATDRSLVKEIAIGWEAIGDLGPLATTREAFKSAYSKAFPDEKPGAIPVKAGVLYRFAKEMSVGDIIIYPSRADRLVNIGVVAGDYRFDKAGGEYPHKRMVDWKVHLPRAQFSQPALYEIGSAITLFEVSNNAEEFLAALSGQPMKAQDVDEASAAEISTQADESVEDFIIKRLKSGISSEQFEHFIAGLLRSMGYYTRVSRYTGDGGVDIIAHKDELGFEPPIIKVQCKQTLQGIGGPAVQQLLGAIQPNEHAMFVTLGDYSSDAVRIERGKSNMRLIGGTELVHLILSNYEKLDSRFKTLLPLKRSYTPSGLSSDRNQAAE